MMVYREIYEPIYEVKLIVIAKCNVQEAEKCIKRKFKIIAGIEPDAKGALLTTPNVKQYILWMKNIRDKTIIHECSHLIDYIYDSRSIEHDAGCDGCTEHRAHQITGWINLIKSSLRK